MPHGHAVSEIVLSIQTFGCVICHGGNALALDKNLAHTGLRGGKNPSDFSVVETSCGGSECHSGAVADHNDHIQRAVTSIQGTYAGAIAQVRRSFGAQPEARRYGIYAITDSRRFTQSRARWRSSIRR
jgi:hypothetical protein